MAKFWTWRTRLVLALILASALTYAVHYLIFRDFRHILIYLIGDIAFMFINVLVVTLVIEQILEGREKRALMKKMNENTKPASMAKINIILIAKTIRIIL